MYKITDTLKLDADDIKRELLAQVDTYRQEFDAVLYDENITDQERLTYMVHIRAQCAGHINFMRHKLGIIVRFEDGMLLSHSGYFNAHETTVRAKIAKAEGRGSNAE